MDKEKKARTRDIDIAIVGCAMGQGCNEDELVRLAIDYATKFHCPYQLSASHMRSLETDAERETALRLEANMNKVIRHTMRRTTPGISGLGRLVMQRLTDQPKPNPREIVRTCKCSASHRSPTCDVPVELCKHTASKLAKMVSRRSRKSGGRKSKSSKSYKRRRY
jgi:hypothetical protein